MIAGSKPWAPGFGFGLAVGGNANCVRPGFDDYSIAGARICVEV
jgi:hypothetical protein